MFILVNYAIKDDKLKIKKYQSNGNDIIVYDRNGVAILDDNLDFSQNLTLIKTENEPFPLIVTQKYANKILKEKEKEVKEDAK